MKHVRQDRQSPFLQRHRQRIPARRGSLPRKRQGQAAHHRRSWPSRHAQRCASQLASHPGRHAQAGRPAGEGRGHPGHLHLGPSAGGEQTVRGVGVVGSVGSASGNQSDSLLGGSGICADRKQVDPPFKRARAGRLAGDGLLLRSRGQALCASMGSTGPSARA